MSLDQPTQEISGKRAGVSRQRVGRSPAPIRELTRQGNQKTARLRPEGTGWRRIAPHRSTYRTNAMVSASGVHERPSNFVSSRAARADLPSPASPSTKREGKFSWPDEFKFVDHVLATDQNSATRYRIRESMERRYAPEGTLSSSTTLSDAVAATSSCSRATEGENVR